MGDNQIESGAAESSTPEKKDESPGPIEDEKEEIIRLTELFAIRQKAKIRAVILQMLGWVLMLFGCAGEIMLVEGSYEMAGLMIMLLGMVGVVLLMLGIWKYSKFD